MKATTRPRIWRRHARMVLVRQRGIPDRRVWCPPTYAEVEVLRELGGRMRVQVTELIRAWQIHRARIERERGNLG